jgi:anti-sigma factor RsiW
MKCDAVRRMLEAYLNGEVDVTRQLNVEGHLAGCPSCRDLAEDITSFCSLVDMNTAVYKAPPELRAKIRATLGKESKSRVWWLSQFSLPLAYSATVLVLSFGLTWTWRTFSRDNDQELIAQAIGNHARSLIAVHLLDVTSSDQKAVKPWFIGKLDYSPPVVDLAQAGYPLIGGRIDMLDRRPVAAIVYQHGNYFINLFVWPVFRRKIDLNVRSDRGYQFCGWNKAGLNYLCISEVSSIALEAFEDEVREHTKAVIEKASLAAED